MINKSTYLISEFALSVELKVLAEFSSELVHIRSAWSELFVQRQRVKSSAQRTLFVWTLFLGRLLRLNIRRLEWLETLCFQLLSGLGLERFCFQIWNEFFDMRDWGFDFEFIVTWWFIVLAYLRLIEQVDWSSPWCSVWRQVVLTPQVESAVWLIVFWNRISAIKAESRRLVLISIVELSVVVCRRAANSLRVIVRESIELNNLELFVFLGLFVAANHATLMLGSKVWHAIIVKLRVKNLMNNLWWRSLDRRQLLVCSSKRPISSEFRVSISFGGGRIIGGEVVELLLVVISWSIPPSWLCVGISVPGGLPPGWRRFIEVVVVH